MEYYLPTYEECKRIVDAYSGLQFYESVSIIDGYKVSTFNYRLIQYSEFVHPLGEDSPTKAFELRGLCFVFNKDGSLYKRFLLMNKFFNLNQVETTQYDLVKDYKFKCVEDKADGSVINFIQLPNGRILSKSKMQTDNEQALNAYDVYESNEELVKLVDWALSNDIMPIFEYVSPTNRVVLKYKKTDLILLKLRDLKTGHYLDFDVYTDIDKINVVKQESYTTWDEILPLVDTAEEKEGWVITLLNHPFVDMLKLKTKWYCDRHHVLTESIHREDFLIEQTLNETIDDVVAQVDPDDEEVLAIIENVQTIVYDYLKRTKLEVEKKVASFWTDYEGDSKKYALQNRKDKHFAYVMNIVKGYDMIDIIKKDMLRKTYRLEKAREFIEKGDF
jgi:T4 RnlA family RNA ligase